MAGVTSRNLDTPDETRTPDKTLLQLVQLDGAKVARGTLQPGWKWSECIKPVVGTDSCQAHHLGVLMSGGMHAVHDDGSEIDVHSGEVYEIQPGHDAWVLGDAPVVFFEFDPATATDFAKG